LARVKNLILTLIILKTPEPIIGKLNAEMVKIFRRPDGKNAGKMGSGSH